jgi:O-methyltransferase domain
VTSSPTGEPDGHGDATDLAERCCELLLLADLAVPMAVRAICQLGIADELAAGPRTAAELASAADADVAALDRVLRLLAGYGLFRADGPAYALTPAADLLRHSHPLSMRHAYQPPGLELAAWAELDYSIRTGRAAFEHVHGTPHRQYRAEHPDEDARMDRAHRVGTRIEVLTIVRSYDWSSVRVVVDIGGGTGALLVGLLSRYRHLRGVLFDLPQMLANAGEVLSGSGIADRCEVVPGDFFAGVPADADVYVLKSVLGGWDDDSSVRILSSVRQAMRDDSRVLIIEPVLQYGKDFLVGSIVHMQSLVLYGGPDRTREEFEELLAKAGLRLNRIIPRPTMPLIEAVTG